MDFNSTGVTGSNLPAFLLALRSFTERKGYKAGLAWLTKLNPWVETHVQGEMVTTTYRLTPEQILDALLEDPANQWKAINCQSAGGQVMVIGDESAVGGHLGCG